MPTARLNGIDIYYELSGSGHRLLYLNGSGATLATTAVMIESYRARFEVLVHDQRGLGRTSIPPGPYTMADYAADALALMDHAGWETGRVIGVSFGGMVAQELAATAPQRVERLVLACTSPGGAGGSSYPLHELAGLEAAQRSERMLTLLDTRFTPGYLDAHPADKALAGMIAARRPSPGGEEARRGEMEQLLARTGHDVVERLGRVTCPTLVAAGRYDGIAPLANSEAIARRVPGATLRAYEGGHLFVAQDARAMPEILDFLDGD